jgi:hypothetical protein
VGDERRAQSLDDLDRAFRDSVNVSQGTSAMALQRFAKDCIEVEVGPTRSKRLRPHAFECAEEPCGARPVCDFYDLSRTSVSKDRRPSIKMRPRRLNFVIVVESGLLDGQSGEDRLSATVIGGKCASKQGGRARIVCEKQVGRPADQSMFSQMRLLLLSTHPLTALWAGNRTGRRGRQ